MLKNIKKRNEGFTIIEVLIVLAIAGLILLVVFLAVPALQRNSRNTQRKQDVSAVLGGVQEYVNNNAGTAPASIANIMQYAKTGYYKTSDISLATSAGNAALSNNDKVVVAYGAKCATDPTTGAATGATVAGSTRQVAVQYMIDGSSSLVAACQDS